MAVETSDRPINDTYLDLVREFRLTHIKNGRHLGQAQRMIDRLLQQGLDDGAQEYLDVLTDLVETYEDEHFPIPDVSEADVLRELIRSNNLTQSQLAKKVGIAQSTISAVLNGARPLTREHMVKLANFFHVAPAAFLPAPNPSVR
jgi:HTH-type transcriptional regulator / antitoxin HigA